MFAEIEGIGTGGVLEEIFQLIYSGFLGNPLEDFLKDFLKKLLQIPLEESLEDLLLQFISKIPETSEGYPAESRKKL